MDARHLCNFYTSTTEISTTKSNLRILKNIMKRRNLSKKIIWNWVQLHKHRAPPQEVQVLPPVLLAEQDNFLEYCFALSEQGKCLLSLCFSQDSLQNHSHVQSSHLTPAQVLRNKQGVKWVSAQQWRPTLLISAVGKAQRCVKHFPVSTVHQMTHSESCLW